MTEFISDEEEPLFKLDLIEDPEDLGAAKTFRGDQVTQQRSTGLVLVLRQLFAIHGTWQSRSSESSEELAEGDWDPVEGVGEPASLLVYNLELSNQSKWKSTRFKVLKLGFRFESIHKMAAADPVVKSFSPGSDGKIGFFPTSVVRSKKKTVTGAIDAGQLPISVPTSVTKGFEEGWDWKEDVRSTLEAVVTTSSYNRSRKQEDQVEWTLKENPLQKDIPDRYTFAILLWRANDDVFNMHFKANINGGVLNALSSGAQKIKRIVGAYKPTVGYTPIRTAPSKCPLGINLNKLGELRRGDELDKIVFQNASQAMQPVRLIADQVQTSEAVR
jgi:hypothetical protein